MSKKLLFIILGAVVILGGGGVGAFFLMSGGEEKKPAEEAEQTKPAGLVEMETFMVNIRDKNRERFAKLDVRLTVVPAGMAGRINEDILLQAKMRDRILSLLTTKNYEVLSTSVGKEGFRREIKTALTPLVEDGEIQEVLFTNFVIQ
jgi:flagellar FliL protein